MPRETGVLPAFAGHAGCCPAETERDRHVRGRSQGIASGFNECVQFQRTGCGCQVDARNQHANPVAEEECPLPGKARVSKPGYPERPVCLAVSAAAFITGLPSGTGWVKRSACARRTDVAVSPKNVT